MKSSFSCRPVRSFTALVRLSHTPMSWVCALHTHMSSVLVIAWIVRILSPVSRTAHHTQHTTNCTASFFYCLLRAIQWSTRWSLRSEKVTLWANVDDYSAQKICTFPRNRYQYLNLVVFISHRFLNPLLQDYYHPRGEDSISFQRRPVSILLCFYHFFDVLDVHIRDALLQLQLFFDFCVIRWPRLCSNECICCRFQQLLCPCDFPDHFKEDVLYVSPDFHHTARSPLRLAFFFLDKALPALVQGVLFLIVFDLFRKELKILVRTFCPTASLTSKESLLVHSDRFRDPLLHFSFMDVALDVFWRTSVPLTVLLHWSSGLPCHDPIVTGQASPPVHQDALCLRREERVQASRLLLSRPILLMSRWFSARPIPSLFIAFFLCVCLPPALFTCVPECVRFLPRRTCWGLQCFFLNCCATHRLDPHFIICTFRQHSAPFLTILPSTVLDHSLDVFDGTAFVAAFQVSYHLSDRRLCRTSVTKQVGLYVFRSVVIFAHWRRCLLWCHLQCPANGGAVLTGHLLDMRTLYLRLGSGAFVNDVVGAFRTSSVGVNWQSHLQWRRVDWRSAHLNDPLQWPHTSSLPCPLCESAGGTVSSCQFLSFLQKARPARWARSYPYTITIRMQSRSILSEHGAHLPL